MHNTDKNDKMETVKEISKTTMKWGRKNISLIKGLSALLLGIALVYLSHRLILNLVVFSFGLVLIYFGLKELRLKKITDFIDNMIAKIKSW